MFDNSDMIGEYKGIVKNKVITALLQSYLDTLDYDGMKSILREAELLELKDMRDVDQNGTIDFFSFKKLIAAQNCLLYDSNDLLYEIGRKFAFYLFPYGKNFEEVIKEINELIITDWKVSLVNRSEYSVLINVEKCVFCSEIGVSCCMFKGFLVNTLEKTLATDYRVIQLESEEDVRDPNHNNFIFKLMIEKTFKI
jgi:hypothetical protein